jgi:hypothetical protein
MLEGKFSSLYRNRSTQAQRDSLASYGSPFKGESDDKAKIIVAGDGDMVLNDLLPDPNSQQPIPLPMGWNKYTYREVQKESEFGKLFIPVANRDFVLNCVEYMVNSADIMETRNKDIVLRLLDSQKISEQRTTWQFINIGLTILLIILTGFIYQQVRKRRYAA